MTLNERIAKVKGWAEGKAPPGWPHHLSDEDGCVHDVIPDWSGSIADAWELVEELEQHGQVCILTTRNPKSDRKWKACVDKFLPNERWEFLGAGFSATAPKAICLAYLAVMEGEDALRA